MAFKHYFHYTMCSKIKRSTNHRHLLKCVCDFVCVRACTSMTKYPQHFILKLSNYMKKKKKKKEKTVCNQLKWKKSQYSIARINCFSKIHIKWRPFSSELNFVICACVCARVYVIEIERKKSKQPKLHENI